MTSEHAALGFGFFRMDWFPCTIGCSYTMLGEERGEPMSEKFTQAQFEKLKTLVRYFFHQMLEPTDLELIVHVTVISMLKMAYADHAPTEPLPQIIDAALNAVREKPELQAAMHEKYHVSLEKFLQRFSEGIPESKGLETWLQDLKPTRWVH